MKAQKRKRLQESGWVETSLEDFLDLSSADLRYIEAKLALSRRLREVREARHMTQTKAASLVKTSQSRFARMEAGDPSVSLDLLIRVLFAFGLTWKDLGRIRVAR